MTELAASVGADGDDLDLPSLSFTADDYNLLDEPSDAPTTTSAVVQQSQPTSQAAPSAQQPQTQSHQPGHHQEVDPTTVPLPINSPLSSSSSSVLRYEQPARNEQTDKRITNAAVKEDDREVEFVIASPSHPTTASPPALPALSSRTNQPALESPTRTAQPSSSSTPHEQSASHSAFVERSTTVNSHTAVEVKPAVSSAATAMSPSAAPTAPATTSAIKPSSSSSLSSSPTHTTASSTAIAPTRPSPSTPSHSSQSKPSHRTNPSLLTFERNKTTLNLDALNLTDPLDYLRMLRTVLTLQRKCRIWRKKTQAKIKARVEAEKAKQEQELQLKLYNKRQQRKMSAAYRTSQANLPPVVPDSPASASPPVAPVAPAAEKRKLWTVELPDSEEHRLKFTLCMMKIQRAFRGKLVRARVRLQEKLKANKEQQEKEMADKIEKRKAAKQAQAAEKLQQQQQQAAGTQALKESAALPAPIPLPTQTLEGEELLQGSLTSRLRKDRDRRREEREKEDAERRALMVDSQVQVDVDELRETAALGAIPASALFVPLVSPEVRPVSRAAEVKAVRMEVAVVPDSRLKEQHLRILALLSTLPVAVPQQVRVGSGSGSGSGGVGYLVDERLGELEWVSSALYDRVFGGRTADGLDDDEDWESIVHLPLPVAMPSAVPASPGIEL